MAAWRYGDQLGRRRRDQVAWVVAIAATTGIVAMAGPAIGLAAGSALPAFQLMHAGRALYNRSTLRTKLPVTGAKQPFIIEETAVKYLETAKDPHSFFSKETARARGLAPLDGEPLTDFPSPVRLALEMMAHEDVERRALQGELAVLETAWREAEEIAGIADDLLVPRDVDSWMSQFRSGAKQRNDTARDDVTR
jgi:hypothetical protein